MRPSSTTAGCWSAMSAIGRAVRLVGQKPCSTWGVVVLANAQQTSTPSPGAALEACTGRVSIGNSVAARPIRTLPPSFLGSTRTVSRRCER